MNLTIAGDKGGVGKTTTALCLAAYLNTLAPTLLLDGDRTKNAVNCARRRLDFPFRVEPIEAGPMLARQFEHIVTDTGQSPTLQQLKAAADWCDLLVIPAKAAWFDTNSLAQTIQSLHELKVTKYRVLLTHVAPDEAAEALELRRLLASIGAPVFLTEIPRLKAFKKAADAGTIVSASTDKNGARAWAAYEAVGKELGL
jgi:chromosome partitioning protein